MIEIENVSKRYGSVRALRDVSLRVEKGSVLGLLGQNGAGKTTLINILTGYLAPSSGRVLIDGRDARARSQLWLHSNIGYVLQTPHLFSGTVLENLRYGRPDATMDEIEAAEAGMPGLAELEAQAAAQAEVVYVNL